MPAEVAGGRAPETTKLQSVAEAPVVTVQDEEEMSLWAKRLFSQQSSAYTCQNAPFVYAVWFVHSCKVGRTRLCGLSAEHLAFEQSKSVAHNDPLRPNIANISKHIM